MSFVLRMMIALTLSSLLPLFVVNHSLPYARADILGFGYSLVWLFLIPISLYSSAVVSVDRDSHSHPIQTFLRVAQVRSAVGRWGIALSVAYFLAYLLFADYEFAQKYEWIALGPCWAIFPVAAYLYITPMCPYCRKLNQPQLLKCENCGNSLLPHRAQRGRSNV